MPTSLSWEESLIRNKLTLEILRAQDEQDEMELWSPRGMVSTAPEDIFAPRNFSEYVGQEDSKSLAQVMIQAAQLEHRPLPNIMIVGEYGLGKTSLAQIIMKEYGEPIKLVDGASVNVQNFPSGHIIIDEIHNLANDVADSLNVQIDQNKVHIVGCTTNPGSLPSAFRSRFRMLQLDSYDVVNLTEILRRVVERKQVSATRDILSQIALRSRFNARYALSNLALVFDLITIRNQTTITKPVITEAFSKLGIDSKGFLRRDYKFMAALPDDKAVGLQYLSAITGIDSKTIEEEVEPYLLRMGLLDRTSRGRLKLREIQ